ncbi:MAG TPA: putative Ig domain-containing protein [Devosiaceae bacterium]
MLVFRQVPGLFRRMAGARLQALVFVVSLLAALGVSGSAFADCTSPQTATIVSGGSATFTCALFGFISPPNQDPSHGDLTFGTPQDVYALIYQNHDDGATSDSFIVKDDFANPIQFNITITPQTSPLTVSPATIVVPVIGAAYSQTFSTTGGTGPYTYSISGNSPPGLTLSGNTLSGTPTGAGPYAFTVHVSDNAGVTIDKNYSTTIDGPTLTVSPSGPQTAAVNHSYSLQLSTTGGTAPYTYSLNLGSLPAGLTLSSGGLISGTPTAIGPNSFSVKSQDSTSNSLNAVYFVAKTIDLTVSAASPPGAPTIGTVTAGNGIATVNFAPPASDGGAAIDSYTVTPSPSGAPVSGSGSPIVVNGLTNGTAYTFTVTAKNAVGTGSASSPSGPVTPQGPQSITFNNPGTQIFGTTPTLTASATSGLAVSFTSTTTGVCTITTTGTLTFVSAGSCTINANQGGNTAFLPAAQVGQAFTVNAVAPGAPIMGTATAGDGDATVTFTAPANNGGTAITRYTATSSPGGLEGTDFSSPITIPGLTNGVDYTFTVTAMNSAGTGGASASSNAVTPKAAQTITFNNPGSQNFGTTPTLTATSDSSLTIEFTSATPGVCAISQGVLTFLAKGNCTINADQGGDAVFLEANQVSQTFTVNAVAPGAPTIGTATARDGAAAVSFTAPANTGGDNLWYYTVTSSPGGIVGIGSGSPISVIGLTNGIAYTFTVAASNSTGPGPSSEASNSVTPAAAQTITFNNPGSQNFGTTPTLMATSDSGLTPTFTSTTPLVCDITRDGVLTFHLAGTCTIAADQAGNAGYQPAPTVTQSFSVGAVAPDAPVIGVATAGNMKATVSFSPPAATGGSNITDYTVTSNPGGFTSTGSASPIDVAGLTNGTSYTFTVTARNGIGTSSASAASNPVTPQAIQTITFANPGTQSFGTTPTLTASADSGLVPTFTSSTPAVCTITSSGLLTFVAGGTCTINADQAGDGAHQAAATVSQSFAVLAPIALSPSTLPDGTQRVAYSQAITASGGTGSYTYSVSGTLPAGLSLSGSGILAGTPTASGSFSFTVTADDGSTTGAQPYTLVIKPAASLVFSPAAGKLPKEAMVAEDYDQVIDVTGGIGTISFAISAGKLPDGLSLDAATGEIKGKPATETKGKTYSFTVTATSTDGSTGSAAYTLPVVERAVMADNKSQDVPAGATPVPVDLTAGATGGPFKSADVVSVEPPQAGTATINMGEVAALAPVKPTSFYLIFKPNPTYSGTARVRFTLTSNTLGVSNPATVTYRLAVDPVKVADTVDELVKTFVQTRQSLLANSIDMPGLIERRAMANGQRPGTLGVSPSEDAMTLNFASSLAELRAWNGAAGAADVLAGPAAAPLPFNFWIDGTATLHVRDEDGTDDHWGRFALLSMGADYLVNDKLLAGVALYANFMDDLTDLSKVSGKGVLAGPYISAEIGNGVFFDASVLYGHSWNDVSTGSFTGNFETDQVLAKAKLEGQWQLGDALLFRPNATALYLRENAGDYAVTDGDGTIVTVKGFTSAQLRLSVGGKLEYTMGLDNGMTVVPYLGANLGLSAMDGASLVDNGFGTLSAGFTLASDSAWRLTSGIELGLEAEGTRSASAKLSLSAGF